jgi:hypothetical protein
VIQVSQNDRMRLKRFIDALAAILSEEPAESVIVSFEHSSTSTSPGGITILRVARVKLLAGTTQQSDAPYVAMLTL